jgi:hypothetical protein
MALYPSSKISSLSSCWSLFITVDDSAFSS